MLAHVFRALFGVRQGAEVDDLLLGWTSGEPRSWTSAPAQRQLPPGP
jgi:hypothetical protein